MAGSFVTRVVVAREPEGLIQPARSTCLVRHKKTATPLALPLAVPALTNGGSITARQPAIETR
jgi:hypothetical protein